MTIWLEKLWYTRHPLRWLLIPAAWAYQVIISLRRKLLQRFYQQDFAVPIIVVGNLSVGGVGKTPLVIALAQRFQQQGVRVGIVSRGYKAEIKQFPHEVNATSEALLVGDEPLLMAKKTGCPVVIAPKRNDAVRYLIDHHASQIILSDDGLQHYAMGRAIEIAVIDGMRGLGNGLTLPAGPLREPKDRLNQVDFLVSNGGQWPGAYPMHLQPGSFVHLKSGKAIDSAQLGESIAAVAGIGHPQRFFASLEQLNVVFEPYSFPDHYFFKAQDLKFAMKSVVMTEKDAVRCQPFAADNWYYLPVEAVLDNGFWQSLCSHQQLKGLNLHETD